MRFCVVPRCPERVQFGRCRLHARQQEAHHNRFRAGTTRYDTARWMRLRDAFRAEHPFCINADRDPRCTLLTDVVDHIQPHRGDEAKMFDPHNLQGMCATCHGRKTAGETWQRRQA